MPPEKRPPLLIDDYSSGSSHLLSRWLDSLETHSSLFWLRCEGIAENPDELDLLDGECEGEELLGEEDGGDSGVGSKGDLRELEEFGMAPCTSIAHRDSDLLVALTENCTLRPVCYFCR